MSELQSPNDPEAETEAQQVLEALEALKPRRRRHPRLAEPLREARDLQVETPFGAVLAWRLDPWGSSGHAPATLLAHGWEDDNALWTPMIQALQDVGRSVVALDLPGHGFSPAEDCSIGRAGAAIRAVAEALGPVDSIVGHSFGCPALVRALADGLKADRAVLIATPIPGAKVSAHYERLKDTFGFSDAVIARVQQLAMEREAIFPLFDYEALAAGMQTRVLFIHSLDDEDCDPENSRTLAERWPGAGLQWTDGLGHRRIAQDEAIVESVVTFIEGP